MDTTRQPGIRIAQIFLERAEFGHRSDFLEHPPNTAVEAEIEITLDSGVLPDGSRGRLRVEVSTLRERGSLYEFRCVLTALIEGEAEGNFPLDRYVVTNGWALLFPFVRETVANLTGRGRFGSVLLDPVNILAMAAKPGAQSDSDEVRGISTARTVT
jgi:preprotein translocase subunit SecB